MYIVPRYIFDEGFRLTVIGATKVRAVETERLLRTVVRLFNRDWTISWRCHEESLLLSIYSSHCC